MEEHKSVGEKCISLGKVVFWIGVVISAILGVIFIATNDGLYFSCTIATCLGMLIVARLLEAVGHAIFLLNDQAVTARKIEARLASQEGSNPITKEANETINEIINMPVEMDAQDKNNTIDSFVDDLKKTFNKKRTDGVTYTVEKDLSNGNQVLVTIDGPRLASKINAAGDNYKYNWSEYVNVQKDLAKYISNQLKQRGLDGWMVLLRVVDSSINKKLLSVYNDTIVYDFLNE